MLLLEAGRDTTEADFKPQPETLPGAMSIDLVGRTRTRRGLAVGAAQRRHEDQEVAADTRIAGQVR